MSRANVLLVGTYDEAIPVVESLLHAGDFAISMSGASRLGAIPGLVSERTDAAIIFISALHHAVELRELMKARPAVRFLFITPSKPPRAAVARIAQESGAAIVPIEEGPMIVTATLVSMLAQSNTTPCSRR